MQNQLPSSKRERGTGNSGATPRRQKTQGNPEHEAGQARTKRGNREEKCVNNSAQVLIKIYDEPQTELN